MALSSQLPSFREQSALAPLWLTLLKSNLLAVVGIQRGFGASVPGDSQNLAAHRPGHPAPAHLALSQGLGCDDLQRCLPISAIPWFVFANAPRLPVLARMEATGFASTVRILEKAVPGVSGTALQRYIKSKGEFPLSYHDRQ